MTKEELAYQCAYDMSDDWLVDNPTWKDVEKAYLKGFQDACERAYKHFKKHMKKKDFKLVMEE